MALPASGAISFSQINTELGRPSSQQLSLSDGAVRTLFGQGAGQVDLNTGHGKSNAVTINLSPNGGQDYNVRNAAVAAGWNQSSVVIINCTNSGVMYASSTGAYGCYINGSFPAGSVINFINNYYIVGKGGTGGTGENTWNNFGPDGGGAGGPALYISTSGATVNIWNNGTIGGGGAGGSGGAGVEYYDSNGYTNVYAAGGSGGGGAGFGAGGPSVYEFPTGFQAGGASGGLTTGGAGVIPNSYAWGAQPGADGGSLGNGAATIGTGNAVWQATGTRLGAIG